MDCEHLGGGKHSSLFLFYWRGSGKLIQSLTRECSCWVVHHDDLHVLHATYIQGYKVRPRFPRNARKIMETKWKGARQGKRGPWKVFPFIGNQCCWPVVAAALVLVVIVVVVVVVVVMSMILEAVCVFCDYQTSTTFPGALCVVLCCSQRINNHE